MRALMTMASDEMFVSLSTDDNATGPNLTPPVLVYFRVPYKGHERLPLLTSKDRVHVRGEIEQINGQGGIQLRNVVVDVVK